MGEVRRVRVVALDPTLGAFVLLEHAGRVDRWGGPLREWVSAGVFSRDATCPFVRP
jgi:hypothetical protein